MAEKKFFVSQEELESAYKELGSTVKVASKFNVSKKLILNYMRRYGIERNKRLSLEDLSYSIRWLALHGRSSSEIADSLGKSLVQINKCIKAFGIEVERYHKGYAQSKAGYRFIRCPDHPNADHKGYVREHILIMTKHLGRLLNEGEVVHHIDGNKSNNSLENLQLMTQYEHKSFHSKQPRKKSTIAKISEDIV